MIHHVQWQYPIVLGAMRWVDVAGRALRRIWIARLSSAICGGASLGSSPAGGQASSSSTSCRAFASELSLAGPTRPPRRVRTTATACYRRWCSRFSGYERALGGTDRHRSCFNAVASHSECIRRAKNPCLLPAPSLSPHEAFWRCGASSISCRSHLCHEEPSRATSLEKCSSLRIPWDHA